MATEVGTLQIEVDTSGVKSAEAAFERLGDEAEKTAKSTNKMSDAAKAFINRSKAARDAIKKQTEEQKKHNDQQKKLPDAANDSGEALGKFGRKAGMAGIQIEQLVGQIAMGQNPMRALGSQAADLGFILGVPLAGAAIGVAAAIASVIPAMTGMGKSAEDLKETMQDLSDIMSVNAVTSAYELDKAFIDLAISSRELAVARLQNSLSIAMLDLGTATDIVKLAVNDLSTQFYESGSAASNFGGNLGAVQATAARLGIAADQVRPLQLALEQVAAGAEGADANIATMIADLEATGNTTQEFRELARALLDAIQTQDEAQSKAAALGDALRNLDDAVERGRKGASGYQQSTEGMIEALENEAYTAGMTAKQIALLAVIRQGEAEGLGPAQLEALYARAEALYDEAEAARAVVAAKKEAAKQLASDQKAAERFKEQNEGAADSRLEAIDREETRKLEKLQEFYDKNLYSLEEYEALRKEIELAATQDRTAAIMAENDKAMKILIEQDRQRKESAMETTNALLSLEDTLFKGKSEKQKAGFRLAVNLMNAEKRENAKNIISNSYDAAMKAYKALAGIPFIGPALGAAAAATVLAAGVSYAAQSLSGRALGGQVRAGESYVVGERGPEILTMGSTGRITPNEAIGGGGQTVNKTANVQFNIAANDTQGFDELLSNRRGLIISMINEAMEDQGRVGIV